MRLSLTVAAIALLTPATSKAQIAFAPLSALPNGTPYTGHTENGFTVAPQQGQLFVANAFGNPVPSVFAGPVFAPVTASLSIVRTAGGTFVFGGVDVSSNTAIGTSYSFVGSLLGSSVFTQAFTPTAVDAFQTYLSTSAQNIDQLVITGTPGAGTTSFNIDNISVTATTSTIPEPGTWALLGTGLLAVGGVAARRKRTAV
jgi:hypothetical protein